MAPGSMLIIDASVVVKWLNRDNELYTEEAKDILITGVGGCLSLVVSDLTCHEVFNALIRGKKLKGAALKEALEAYFLFPLQIVQTNRQITSTAALIAERDLVTFYDAVYCAIAFQYSAALITANPKHQQSARGVQVIPLDQWFSFKQKIE